MSDSPDTATSRIQSETAGNTIPMTTRTRRSILSSIAGVSVALAGCGGSSDNSSPDSGDSGGSTSSTETQTERASPFGSFTFEGMSLIIEFTDAELPAGINVYDPQEAVYAEKSVPAGAEQLSIDFSGYAPGEYRFVAVDDAGDGYAETTRSFQPELEFGSWTHIRKTDYEVEYGYGSSVIELSNAGNAPAQITDLAFSGEYVIEEFSPESVDNERPLIALKSEHYPVTVPPEGSVTLVTVDSALVSVTYPEEELTDEVSLHVYSPSGEAIVAEATAEYRKVEDPQEATLTLKNVEVTG